MDHEIPHSEIRDYLETLGMETLVEELPEEMELVKPPFPDVSCEEYALGSNGVRHSLAALYPQLDEVRAGDVVLYWDPDYGTVHVGTVEQYPVVVSKWGNDGGVFRHHVDKVPSSYGSWVFFRRLPQTEKEWLRGKTVMDMIS